LRAVPLFSGCTDKELAFIASRADEVDIPAGKVLTETGKSGGDFFIILDGKAEVEATQGKRTLGPGDFFGEIALIDNGPRTATVTAIEPINALVIRSDGFNRLMNDYPAVRLGILNAMAQRVRRTSEAVSD
jgi:CRP/FNR family transcriptional regulator, cyclic AMP receptor protein